MFVTGKYNQAKIFTDVIEDKAIDQIKQLCDMEAFADSKIRVMPDVHSGTSCTIGTTMTITDKIVPNMVGVDIGCGMEVAIVKEKELDLPTIDKIIHENVPCGRNVRTKAHTLAKEIDLTALRCVKSIRMELANNSLGTLGGGNHFIEIDRDDDDNKYLVVHSGSRHLGLEVASYYQKEAYKQMCGKTKSQIDDLIKTLKAEGREKDIQVELSKRVSCKGNIDPETAYLTGELFDDYIHDMKIVQRFATLNRKAIIDEIIKYGLTVVDSFTTIHNYIDTDKMILRKGAVSAQKGERLLIPINMRDGALICIGKGNQDWNCSAPHGAGRLMSRKKAVNTLSMEEFTKQMQGVYSTTVNPSTLDESPMAYKNIEDIIQNVKDTVEIQKRIYPIYNFKAGE